MVRFVLYGPENSCCLGLCCLLFSLKFGESLMFGFLSRPAKFLYTVDVSIALQNLFGVFLRVSS